MLRSDEKLTEKERLFMRVLIGMHLNEDEIVGTLALIKAVDEMDKIVHLLREKEFQTTPRETMNIIGKVITERV